MNPIHINFFDREGESLIDFSDKEIAVVVIGVLAALIQTRIYSIPEGYWGGPPALVKTTSARYNRTLWVQGIVLLIIGALVGMSAISPLSSVSGVFCSFLILISSWVSLASDYRTLETMRAEIRDESFKIDRPWHDSLENEGSIRKFQSEVTVGSVIKSLLTGECLPMIEIHFDLRKKPES